MLMLRFMTLFDADDIFEDGCVLDAVFYGDDDDDDDDDDDVEVDELL